MDVFCANSSSGISNSRDKLRSLQILSRHNVGIPQTTFVTDKKDVLPAIKRVGGAPVVIKLLEGTQGLGVVLAESTKAARSIIEAFHAIKVNILIQEFIEESKGRDIRAIVVNGEVVAAMERQGPEGEFRSNLHRGGTARGIYLDPRQRDTALRPAKALGLAVAGVDMLSSSRGPLVMEVNSSPGLEGIEKATDVDIAQKIIRFIENQARRRIGKRDNVGV